MNKIIIASLWFHGSGDGATNFNKKDVPLDAEGKPARKSIKHAHFNEEWVMLGDVR